MAAALNDCATNRFVIEVACDGAADLARMRLAEAMLQTGLGDREAFRLVYELTSAKLFGICLRICRNHAAAEDVLADVYLTIWKQAGAWEPGRASPISWLATIARNRAIDWHRSAVRRQAAPLENAEHVAHSGPDAEMMLISLGENTRLHRSLEELAPLEKWMICTAFFGGFTYAELAKHQGIPVSTVKSKVRRALVRMRRDLEGESRHSLGVTSERDC